MPSIKLKGAKAVERSSGFEPYDGPTPKRKGFYRAVLKKVQYQRNTKGSMGFNIVAELQAAPGDPKDHAQFDGYPMFIRSIITEASDGSELKEGAQRNLDNFLAALNAGDEPEVILEDGDPEEAPVAVKKIGKVNPVDRIVNIDVGTEIYEGEPRPKANGIYKFKDDGAKTSGRNIVDDLDTEEDDDLLDGSEEDDNGYAEREAELQAASLSELKAILKSDYDLPSSGTKPKLIERILEHEFSEEDEAEEDEPEEDEAEVDEPEDDEPEDEEEEDDEEEEADDEAYTARQEELQGFNRVALKKVLSTLAPDFTVLKRHSDDDLREQILANEFGDELPF